MCLVLSLSLFLASQSDVDSKAVESVTSPAKAVLPMLKSARQAPCIELEIGGKKYRFALDTGAVSGRVSPDIVAALGLKPIGEVRAGDPSGKNSRTVKLYRIPEIKAGAVTLHGVRMFADDGVEAKIGPAYLDGVIGYAVFHDLLLTLDYPHNQVILTKGDMPKPEAAKAIHYKTEHGIPMLDVQIGDVKVDGHVDSGADGGLSIPSKYKDKLHMVGEPKLVGHARTLFNTMDIYSVTVKDPVKVGGQLMPTDKIELNDLLPFANIGGRLLHQFTVTIDQKQKLISFEK